MFLKLFMQGNNKMKKLILLTTLLFCGNVFAAKEITQEYTTGQTLYAVIANDSLQIWNGTAFDTTPTTGEWGNYDIAMTEDAVLLGVYYADWPEALTTAGRYRVRVYAGTSPAYTDTVVGSDFYNWSGTAEITLINIASMAEAWVNGGFGAGRYD